MDFGKALGMVKQGYRVARKGWNGKGMYVFLVKGIELQNVIRYNHPDVEEKPCADVLALKATTTIQVGWLASQTDMLAEDWEVIQ